MLTKTLLALGYFLFTLNPQIKDSQTEFSALQAVKLDYSISAKKDDNLLSLARSVYGSADYWPIIWNDNPQIINPSDDLNGKIIKIRYIKPLLIEETKSERIANLLIDKNNKPLDSGLAFKSAESNTQIQSNSLINVGNKEEIAAAVAYFSPQPINTDIKVDSNSGNYEDVYKKAGEKYGVPWQVLYGLHLTETGLRDGAISNGQGSGAQGPMQFMPETWSAYGVDGNGDGVADINNAVDAVHGAANFLAKHGNLQQGLNSYGGNTSGTLIAACEKGYCQ